MRSYSRKRAKKKNIIGVIILCLSIVVAGVIFYVYQKAVSNRVKIDDSTLCPVNGPSSVTVVLVDGSDKLNDYQKETIKRKLLNIKNGLRLHELLEIYSIGKSSDELITPIISMCNPGKGDNSNVFVENPKLIQKKWQNEFSNKIDNILKNVLEKEDSTVSPIMENIHSVSILSFIEIENREIPKRLILISDMIQNTEVLSQYKQKSSFTDFSQSQKYIKVRSDLKNVEIVLYYLRRDDLLEIQGKSHIEFWQKFFHHSGATLSTVESIN